MRKLTRRAAFLLSAVVAVPAFAQAPPALPAPSPTPAVAPAAPEARPAGVAAKVNAQEIPEVSVYRALRQFPPAEREVARKEILNHLIDNVLIDQYLTALRMTAEAAEVDKMIGELKDELKKGMKEYAKELDAMMLTEAEFRTEVASQMKWDKFVQQQGTDDALKKLFEAMPNTFDGSMVRVRHILMNPAAGDAVKMEEAKKTLLAIKQTVETEAAKVAPAGSGDAAKEAARGTRIDELFTGYAKQYSTCPSKANGGDLNFFPRVGAMVEPFSAAAFALQPFQMSEVVTTEFGMHMILCTAKKPGTPRKFEQVKEDVRAVYAIRLREAVVAQMRPKAQINATPTK